MKTELELDDGKWLELETVEDGILIGRLGETGIDWFFKQELKERKKPESWSVYSRYFAFQNNDGSIGVMMGIGEGSKWLRNNGKHITGYRNQDPFPAYASHIRAMGKHLGIELDERHSINRRPSLRDDEPSSPSP